MQQHEHTMVKRSTKPAKLELANIRLGAKLEYVVPIINFTELAFALQKSGYSINPPGPQPIFTGIRGTSQVYLDGIRGVFGAHTPNLDDAISTVEDIFATVKEEFDFELDKYVSFFEFEINATYYTNKDVYGEMANLFQDSSDMKTLNNILEGSYAQTSLKLTPLARNINSLDWFDLTIEPKVNSVGNAFVVRLLYRNPSLKNMIDKVKKQKRLLAPF